MHVFAACSQKLMERESSAGCEPSASLWFGNNIGRTSHSLWLWRLPSRWRQQALTAGLPAKRWRVLPLPVRGTAPGQPAAMPQQRP